MLATLKITAGILIAYGFIIVVWNLIWLISGRGEDSEDDTITKDNLDNLEAKINESLDRLTKEVSQLKGRSK